ncbi:MAG: LLM class F420-dependent oxidoreductase [Actinomycetota bacterium]
MTRLGYQIPNFTYPGIEPAQTFDSVVAQAKEAEASGFDRVTVMDHFYQLPGIGAPDEAMFECYTMLSALAQHTDSVRLSAMVTGNTYRNPAMLAKTVTALDHASAGRATLAIGAGWYEEEHTAFGYEFGTFTDRFEKLEEALQIIIPMLRGEQASLDGKHYTAVDAVNSPAPISRVPIMIGGNGEKKTLRMVAQYADESNLVGLRDPSEIPRKLEALDQHCANLGRDRSEIKVTLLAAANVAPTMEEAEADLAALAERKGWPPQAIDMAKGMLVHGDPDTVGEGLSNLVVDGIDGLVISHMPGGHIPGRVALLGEVAGKVLG